MLAAEGALLLLLTRQVKSATGRRLKPSDAHEALRSGLTTEIFLGRRRARELARKRLTAELGLFDIAVPEAMAGAGVRTDVIRAHRAARGYAWTWDSNYGKAVAEGARKPMAEAVKRSIWKLELDAITETASAFSLERDLAAREALFRPRLVSELEWSQAELAAARGLRGPAGELLEAEASRLAMAERKVMAERELWAMGKRHPAAEPWYKVWDASLDKRSCQTCSHAAGKSVPVGEDFPEGEPGGVHPRCRCVPTFLPASWVDFGFND